MNFGFITFFFCFLLLEKERQNKSNSKTNLVQLKPEVFNEKEREESVKRERDCLTGVKIKLYIF